MDIRSSEVGCRARQGTLVLEVSLRLNECRPLFRPWAAVTSTPPPSVTHPSFPHFDLIKIGDCDGR